VKQLGLLVKWMFDSIELIQTGDVRYFQPEDGFMPLPNSITYLVEPALDTGPIFWCDPEDFTEENLNKRFAKFIEAGPLDGGIGECDGEGEGEVVSEVKGVEEPVEEVDTNKGVEKKNSTAGRKKGFKFKTYGWPTYVVPDSVKNDL
jgi:hypothetical protein